MAQEIERKFLAEAGFREEARSCIRIVQGYLSSVPERTVRVRIWDGRGFITVKGKGNRTGMSRYEWEKEIPAEEAEELLALCEPGVIDKERYLVDVGDHVFEVDVFHGENEGLVMAEVELGSEDEAFRRPAWLGREVTGDARYYNASLVRRPYRTWGQP